MEEELIDDLLAVLGNSTRRKILQHLALASYYPLQLSRELDVSQQAVTKQLRILEEMQIVGCTVEDSEAGPPHKSYVSQKRMTLTVDLGPNLFDTRVLAITEEQLDKEYLDQMLDRIGVTEEDRELDFDDIQKMYSQVKDEAESLESRRITLLYLKDRILIAAKRYLDTIANNSMERGIYYYLLEHPQATPMEISDMLDIRVKVVEQALEKLKGGIMNETV